MKIFVGDSSGRKTIARLKEANIGRMMLTGPRKLYDGEVWAHDNGAFTWWKEGKPFDETTYMRRLEKFHSQMPYAPYLAVLPDIVAGGDASWEFSLKWLNSGKLPAEWPWYLAVQDGMDTAWVISILDRPDIAGLFLGGTDEYKKQALFWSKVVRHFKKPLHYGRAGTLSKLAHAMMVGVDSLDSTFPLWTYQRLDAFIMALGQQVFFDQDDFILLKKLPHLGEGSYGGLKCSPTS